MSASDSLGVCVPPDRIGEVWPKVEKFIRAAIVRGEVSAFAPVKDAVHKGEALLWVVVRDLEIEAAVVTSLEQTETKKVCTIVACGGKNMRHWLPLITEIENYATAEGCDAVRIFGREGWGAVLPSYRPRAVMLEKDLG